MTKLMTIPDSNILNAHLISNFHTHHTGIRTNVPNIFCDCFDCEDNQIYLIPEEKTRLNAKFLPFQMVNNTRLYLEEKSDIDSSADGYLPCSFQTYRLIRRAKKAHKLESLRFGNLQKRRRAAGERSPEDFLEGEDAALR